MSETWEFFKDDAGGWGWRYSDGVVQRDRQSIDRFVSRNDCIADAMRHGYLAARIAPALAAETAEPQSHGTLAVTNARSLV
jgi:hypothetical protein